MGVFVVLITFNNMQQQTKERLELFARHNNWQLPHWLDHERFYQFIIEAFKNGDKESDDEEFRLVIEPIYQQVSDSIISYWLVKYQSGIELLSIYNKSF
jgi:hypothetical protein